MSFWDAVDTDDPVEELLNNPDSTFNEVFNEPTMLQDLRCTNEKLMTFFLKKEHVEQLCECNTNEGLLGI